MIAWNGEERRRSARAGVKGKREPMREEGRGLGKERSNGAEEARERRAGAVERVGRDRARKWPEEKGARKGGKRAKDAEE